MADFEISAKGGSAFGGKNINIAMVARAIGYVIIDTKENGQYNLVRKLTAQSFPRFHAYVKQNGLNLKFSLHLDWEKPSKEGSHADSGEYFGPLIDNESDRIKDLLK